MRFITIAPSGQRISRIAMGTTYFGTAIDGKTSFLLLDTFATHGGTTVDTARVYGQDTPGKRSLSEELIGKWLKETGMRQHIYLITKGGHPDQTTLQPRITAQHLDSDIQQSLDALGCDTVDLYFLHRDDPALEPGQIMEMTAPLVKSGKACALGASNWSIARITQANQYAQAHHLPQFVASELHWSLADCTPQIWGDNTLQCMTEEALSWYREHHFPVFAYSSQAKGLFSKAISCGYETLNGKIRQRYLTDKNRRRVERVRQLSLETGLSPAAIVTAYITRNSMPSVAITGCSTLPQLLDTLSGEDVVLTESQIAFLLD
ncbi:MAG: aldo/keto reductase [Sphaerochaetaceae bacterium]